MRRLLNMHIPIHIQMLILGIAIGIQLGVWTMIIAYSLPY
jgi:hypothetical protein